jgi:hypothetical protein
MLMLASHVGLHRSVVPFSGSARSPCDRFSAAFNINIAGSSFQQGQVDGYPGSKGTGWLVRRTIELVSCCYLALDLGIPVTFLQTDRWGRFHAFQRKPLQTVCLEFHDIGLAEDKLPITSLRQLLRN